MRSRLYYHIVWTTRSRQPTVDEVTARFLQGYLRAIAKQERARVIAIGVVSTHVHVLVEAHPTTSLPRLVQRFKGGSSILINREGHVNGMRSVRWAKGYSIHTVGFRGLRAARDYVLRQAERHPEERLGDDS